MSETIGMATDTMQTERGIHEPQGKEVSARTSPQEALLMRAYLFAKVFNTADGQEILAILEAELNPMNIFSDCPQRSSFNLGKRDGYMYIEQLLRIARTHGE